MNRRIREKREQVCKCEIWICITKERKKAREKC